MKNNNDKDLENILEDAEDDEDCDENESATVADQYVQVATDAGLTLFHDQYRAAFGHLPDKQKSIIKINSKNFAQWLAHKVSEVMHKAAQRNALSTAQLLLSGRAIYDSPEFRLDVRIASRDGAIWIDLGNGRAIRVDKSAWQIVEDVPIIFRSYSHQRPQDDPVHGGNIKEMLEFLNIPGDSEKLAPDQILFLAWTVFAFVPDYPHPILTLHGPHGSAKTTAFKILKHLIDPSSLETMALMQDRREFIQQAAHHYLVAFDNLTNISSETSDLLCRLVTGEGYSKRELYTDDDDVIYELHRAVGLNGINIGATKADLLDRSLLIGFKRLNKNYLSNKSFWSKFFEAKPRIFGAILDILVGALQIIDSIPEPGELRMADFGQYGCAITEAMGLSAEDFLNAYRTKIREQNEEALAAHILAPAIVSFMEGRNEWSGTATDLFGELEYAAEQLKIDTKSKYWPKDPNWLGKRIKEVVPNLEEVGIVFKWNDYGQRNITIVKNPQTAANAVDAAPNSNNSINSIFDNLPPLS